MGKKYIIAFVIVILISAGAFILRKATDKESVQHIIVQQGGTAIIQQNETKDNKRWFIPFIEFYGQTDTNSETKGVAKCGLRLEF